MLEIILEPEHIQIGSEAVPYYSYYFDIWDRHGDPGLPVLRRVVAQWADAVERLCQSQPTVYLPFSLDDEVVEAFRARLMGDKVAFRRVALVANGWAIHLDNLLDFMQQDHPIYQQDAQDFGAYELAEIISALRGARIHAA